jgi:hypothetical protein
MKLLLPLSTTWVVKSGKANERRKRHSNPIYKDKRFASAAIASSFRLVSLSKNVSAHQLIERIRKGVLLYLALFGNRG